MPKNRSKQLFRSAGNIIRRNLTVSNVAATSRQHRMFRSFLPVPGVMFANSRQDVLARFTRCDPTPQYLPGTYATVKEMDLPISSMLRRGWTTCSHTRGNSRQLATTCFRVYRTPRLFLAPKHLFHLTCGKRPELGRFQRDFDTVQIAVSQIDGTGTACTLYASRRNANGRKRKQHAKKVETAVFHCIPEPIRPKARDVDDDQQQNLTLAKWKDGWDF